MEQTRNRLKSENELIDLATPVFQLVMGLKSGGATPPGEELRRTVDAILRQIEQVGAGRGYKEEQLQNVKFALAAFVDEAVLAGNLKEEWEKYPLQLEYFREALAGMKFFDRLDDLVKRGLRKPEFLIVDGGSGLDVALAAIWSAWISSSSVWPRKAL